MEKQENKSPGERKGADSKECDLCSFLPLRKHLGKTEALSVSDKCKDL